MVIGTPANFRSQDPTPQGPVPLPQAQDQQQQQHQVVVAQVHAPPQQQQQPQQPRQPAVPVLPDLVQAPTAGRDRIDVVADDDIADADADADADDDQHDDANDATLYLTRVAKRRSTEMERLALWSPVDPNLSRSDRLRSTPTRLTYSHEESTPRRRTPRACRDCDARLTNIMRNLNF